MDNEVMHSGGIVLRRSHTGWVSLQFRDAYRRGSVATMPEAGVAPFRYNSAKRADSADLPVYDSVSPVRLFSPNGKRYIDIDTSVQRLCMLNATARYDPIPSRSPNVLHIGCMCDFVASISESSFQHWVAVGSLLVVP